MSNTTRTYWAAEPDIKKLASLLRERISRFRDVFETSGRRQLCARSTRMLYGLDPEGGYRRSHYVVMEGAEGEDLASRVNVYRAMLKSQLVMVAGSRVSFTCRPIAYDADVEEIVTIGDAWLDKCLDEGVESEAVMSAFKCGYLGEGWVATTWNDVGGDVVSTEIVQGSDGEQYERPICTGAIRTLSMRPDEVIRDTDVTGGPKAHRWVVLQVQRDRWELMAQFPEYANEIRNADDDSTRWLFGGESGVLNGSGNVNGDTITTYELYHKKSLSMPQGLSALLVGDCIVSRSALPYEDLPVDYMLSDREPGSSFGYGEGWDLMAVQSTMDSAWSQATTNQENLGRSTIFMPTGTDIEPYNVGGTRLINGAQPPVVLDLANGGIAACQAIMEMSQGFMQLQTGLNDAALGQGGSASGVALAQQQQTAVAFNGGAQLSYANMLQGIMRKLLRIAQRFMTDEQLIHIAGKNRAPVVKRFKGSDFKALEGVSVELGSAAMRTSGSRHVVANELLQSGAIKDPQTYLEMIATGRTEPALEAPRIMETQAERLMVEVQEGRAYTPKPTMPHAMMIARLATLIADPSMSEGGEPDPRTGQPGQSKGDLAMSLVMQHGDLWNQMSMNPAGMAVLAATGQQPAPGAQMMMQAQQAAAAMPPAPNGQPDPGAEPTANPDVQAPQNAPQPSPSGQQTPGASQPALPEGAMPLA